jgi:hypothetical protein
MVGAKMFLKMIKNQIQDEMKKEIFGFSILHNVTDKRLVFIVEGKEFPFNNDSLMSTIEASVRSSNNIPEGTTIDNILIDYKEDSDPKMTTFFKESNGNKTRKEQIL